MKGLLANLWNARTTGVVIMLEIFDKDNTSGIKDVSKLPPELSLKQQCSCHYYAQDAEDGSDYRHMLGWMQISI